MGGGNSLKSFGGGFRGVTKGGARKGLALRPRPQSLKVEPKEERDSRLRTSSPPPPKCCSLSGRDHMAPKGIKSSDKRLRVQMGTLCESTVPCTSVLDKRLANSCLINLNSETRSTTATCT